MKRVKTNLRCGALGGSMNHNQKLLQVKTGLRSGRSMGGGLNHNEKLVRTRSR